MVEQTPLDLVFGALSDPTRRAIVARLAGGGETAVSELASPFAMSLPAVSKHVSVLRGAGLVEQEKRGRVHYCRLRPDPLREAAAWISDHAQFWQQQLDSLAAHVGGPARDERD
jgi:DNA-binding transcriptional ArsR family regulator